MAQIDTKQLLLQVDASIELLKKNMAAGERTVAEFELEAERQLNKLEARFSGFKGEGLNNSMRAVAQDFKKNFTDIQKLAAQAIELPPLKGGGLNLGAADAKAAADQAQKQAMAINLVVASLERQALATGTLSVAQETQLRAGKAAAAAAEQNAVALRQEAGALERLEMDLAGAGMQQQAFNAQSARTTAETGSARAGMQQLSFQLNDVATMFAAGATPMAIFATQSGQIFQSLALLATGAGTATKGIDATADSSKEAGVDVDGLGETITGVAEKATDAGGKFGAVASFLAGPWGAALIAAVAVLAPFVAKLFEGNTALDAAVQKLKDEAEATEISRQAKEAYKRTIEGQIALQRQLNDAMAQGLISQRALDRQNLENTRINLANQRAQLVGAQNDLAAAKREEAKWKKAYLDAGTDPNLATGFLLQAAEAEKARKAAEAKLLTIRSAVSTSEAGVRTGQIRVATGNAAAAADPILAIQNKYQDQRDAFTKAAQNDRSGRLAASADARLAAIAAAEKRDVEAERKRQQAANKTGSSAETIRQREISNDISFEKELLQARRQLLDASAQSATTELERDALLKEEINGEADAKIANAQRAVTSKARTQEQANQLIAAIEETRQQRLANVDRERLRATVSAQFDTMQIGLDGEIAMLKIQQDMTLSESERRRIARLILEKEQQAAIDHENYIISTSDSQAEIAKAMARRANLLKQQAGERENFDAQPATPGQAYLQGLRREQANLSDSFDEAGINALNRVSTSLSDSVKSALKLHGVLGDIASDFIEIALRQELLLPIANAIWGQSKPGLFGSIASLFGGGFASGGYTGDGSPTDIAGPVHKREFVFDAAATSRIGIPTLEALRRGTYRGPAISTSRIAGGGTSGMARVQLELSGDIDARIDRRSQNVAIDVVRATAPTIQRAAVGETISTLNRQRL